MADYSNYSDYEELDLNGSIEQESQFTDKIGRAHV